MESMGIMNIKRMGLSGILVVYPLMVLMVFGITSCSKMPEKTRVDSISPEEAISRSQKEGRYVILFFYEEGSAMSKKMAGVIEKAKSIWTDKAGFVDIGVNAPVSMALIKRYGIRKYPATLVVAPNGAVTAGFSGITDLKSLKTGFVSPKMAEVIKAIQGEQTIFLSVQNDKIQYSKEALAACNEAASLLEGIARVIEVDPEDKEESELMKEAGIKTPVTKAVTLVISPRGTIVDRFNGQVTKRSILDSFQKVLAKSGGCGEEAVTGGSSCQPAKGKTGSSSCQ